MAYALTIFFVTRVAVLCSNTLAPMFRYTGEHNFNLSEYLVVLDKPIGLVLAPDPVTGQVMSKHAEMDVHRCCLSSLRDDGNRLHDVAW